MTSYNQYDCATASRLCHARSGEGSRCYGAPPYAAAHCAVACASTLEEFVGGSRIQVQYVIVEFAVPRVNKVCGSLYL